MSMFISDFFSFLDINIKTLMNFIFIQGYIWSYFYIMWLKSVFYQRDNSIRY